MHRFYCPQIRFDAPSIDITNPSEIHHLKNVLRLKKGQAVRIFNDGGQEAQGMIESLANQKVSVVIEKVFKKKQKSYSLVLACAIPKKSKFETIIEKATELGVDEIIPLKTKRTQMKFDAKRRAQKMKRYQTVAVNAAKQSKRRTIPHIHAVMGLHEAIDLLKNSYTLVIPSLYGEHKNIFDLYDPATHLNQVAVFIGPEGDFTKDEYLYAFQAGCVPVSLGETVLKVETAALATLACFKMFLINAD